MVTALKHAWLHLGLQELQGGGSKLYIHNRNRSRCQWPLCGYPPPLVKLQPSRNKSRGAAGSRRLQLLTWKKLHGWCHTEEQQSHVPTLPVPPGPRAPAQAPEESSPSQSRLLPPKAVSFGKEPLSSSTVSPAPAQPQQLQLLSQACPGMEITNSNPEPAFGHQPWVWFEILAEVTSHQLQPFSALQCTPSRRSTSSSSLAPQQATLAPDSPSQCQNYKFY